MRMSGRRNGTRDVPLWLRRNRMGIDIGWLRAEAENQGLALTDDDLLAIRNQLEEVKAAIRSFWPVLTEGLEPPYVFAAPRPSQDLLSTPHGPRSDP